MWPKNQIKSYCTSLWLTTCLRFLCQSKSPIVYTLLPSLKSFFSTTLLPSTQHVICSDVSSQLSARICLMASLFFKASFIITVWLKLKFTRYLQHPTPNLTYDPSLQSNLKHPLSNALRLKINTETFTQSTIAKYWLQLNVTLGNNYFALPMGRYCNQFKYIIFYTPLS